MKKYVNNLEIKAWKQVRDQKSMGKVRDQKSMKQIKDKAQGLLYVERKLILRYSLSLFSLLPNQPDAVRIGIANALELILLYI